MLSADLQTSIVDAHAHCFRKKRPSPSGALKWLSAATRVQLCCLQLLLQQNAALLMHSQCTLRAALCTSRLQAAQLLTSCSFDPSSASQFTQLPAALARLLQQHERGRLICVVIRVVCSSSRSLRTTLKAAADAGCFLVQREQGRPLLLLLLPLSSAPTASPTAAPTSVSAHALPVARTRSRAEVSAPTSSDEALARMLQEEDTFTDAPTSAPTAFARILPLCTAITCPPHTTVCQSHRSAVTVSHSALSLACPSMQQAPTAAPTAAPVSADDEQARRLEVEDVYFEEVKPAQPVFRQLLARWI
eukprot:2153-Heterococcus_DN1.PRE.7